MRVWKFWPEDGYEWLHPIKERPLDERYTFDGRSKIADWSPFAVRPLENKTPFGDFATMQGTPTAINKRSVEVLYDLLEGQMELLPLIAADQEWYLLYATNMVDALDFSKSDVKFFSDGKRIMRIRKAVFLEENVVGNHIFKIPQLKLDNPYVSDEFRQRVIDAGLTGIKFELVWDSEAE